MTIAHKTAGAPASNQYGQFTVRYASGNQQRFIARLLAERIHPLGGLDVTTINVKHASDIISQLLKCPPIVSAETRKPSDKQVAFINSLGTNKVDGASVITDCLRNNNVRQVEDLPLATASQLIEVLQTLPTIYREVQVEVGAYEYKGVVYSVRKSRESGRLHAYNWNGGAWVYAGNVKYDLRPEHRLSLRDASAFGAQTGVCIHCGRTLTDAMSVTYGMGSTCRKKYI
jgi:hypothetical protein